MLPINVCLKTLPNYRIIIKDTNNSSEYCNSIITTVDYVTSVSIAIVSQIQITSWKLSIIL